MPMPSSNSGLRDNHTRGAVADFLKRGIRDGSRLSVVSAYFTIYAYDTLKECLDRIDHLDFLFGEPSFVNRLDPSKTEQKSFIIDADGLELANKLQQKRVAKECADWKERKVDIKTIKQSNLLHGKMYYVTTAGETRFVAANALIGLNRPVQQPIRDPYIEAKEAELRRVRERHFLARTPVTKAKCREQDAKIRSEIAELLQNDGWDTATAHKLASWDPYDQNAAASFFDAEWMFGLNHGLDVILGNPPYIRPHKVEPWLKRYLWEHLTTFVAKSDIYSCFMERALEYVRPDGLVTFIVPHTWTSLESFSAIRLLFATKSKVLRLVQLPKKVFTDSTVETRIFLVQKNADPPTNHEIQIERMDDDGNCLPVRKFLQTEIPRQHLYNFQLYAQNATSVIARKLKTNAIPLGELVEFVYGFKTGDDDKFIFSAGQNKDFKRFIRSAAIHRYYYDPSYEFVWYVPSMMTANRKTARPGDKERFEAEKILVSRMGKQLIAAYDKGGLYVKDAMLLLKKQQ